MLQNTCKPMLARGAHTVTTRALQRLTTLRNHLPIGASIQRRWQASVPSNTNSHATPSPSLSDATVPSFLSHPYEHLLLTSRPHQSVTVTLNRPTLHNAFNEHVIAELAHVFGAIAQAVKDGSDLRSIVLTGSGASFSAGADLHWMQKMRTYTEADNLKDSVALFDMIASIHACPIPVIARVNGAALGGGVGLVAACDIAVAVSGAKFGLTEVKLGLSPAVISKFVQPKFGPHASYYFLTGARFDSTEAKRIGLINEEVKDETELDTKVAEIVKELYSNSPAAVQATKQLLVTITPAPNPAATKPFVTSLIARLRTSKEGQDGISSFLEKRKPGWLAGSKKA